MPALTQDKAANIIQALARGFITRHKLKPECIFFLLLIIIAD